MIQDVKAFPVNLGPGWVAMLDLNCKDTSDARHQRFTHQLGTIAFMRKRDRSNDKGDFIGYCNGIFLNADLAACIEWNEAAMTAQMLKAVKSILNLGSSS